jgi:hypothetical protein
MKNGDYIVGFPEECAKFQERFPAFLQAYVGENPIKSQSPGRRGSRCQPAMNVAGLSEGTGKEAHQFQFVL